MPRHAIVIGIDSYKNKKWNLGASVDDALRFAEWVTGPGGVQPTNLRLFLSPRAERPDVRYAPADSRTIRQAILDFRQGAGAGADRLYVYFSGHGLSAPGVTDEPVLVAADVEQIELDDVLLLGFSQIVTALKQAQPSEQFFFLDACRDFGLENFEPAVGRALGPWMPDRDDTAPSRQFILYATSSGQRAYERKALGKGVFTGALLEVLAGKHPEAAPWKQRRYELSFSALSGQVKKLVGDRLARTPGADRYVQLPESVSLRAGDATVTTFASLPKAGVHVRLGPRPARKGCRIRLLTYPPGNLQGRPLGRWRGPPTKSTTRLELSPGEYGLEAQSEGYCSFREPFSVYTGHDFDVELVPLDPDAEPPAPPDASGSLVVTSEDPTAVIAVRDAELTVLKTGHGKVELTDLAPAVYRVQLSAVESETVEEGAVVRPGEETVLAPSAPPHQIGMDQIKMLEKLDIHMDDEGYLHPSEQLGGFANARLASLLAFAAYAAHRTDLRDFRRLRRFGVKKFSRLPQGGAGLLLLVGASGEQPARDVSRERFLGESTFVVRDLEGTSLGVGVFELLTKFPTAAQAALRLVPGCLTAELRLPGLAPTRYALIALPDRVTVLIAVATDDGNVEVQQYLLPVRPVDGDYLSESPENIRRLEVAEHHYAAHRALPEGVAAEDLLAAKSLDPLLGAIAGYSLVQAGRSEEYQHRGMRKMLRQFGGLPDSHVLAALCQPERRDKHFTAATTLGLPIIADGFRELYKWFREAKRDVGRPLWVQPSLLLPSSPWTAWVSSRPVLRVQKGSFERPPVGWDALERRREAIEAVCRSVGRLVPRDGSYPLVATAFLVAPDVVMTMPAALDNRPFEFYVDFGDGGDTPSLQYAVDQLLAFGLHGTPMENVGLLRVSGTSQTGKPLPPPLSLAGSFPDRVEGRAVYAVGFPMSDPRVPEDVISWFGGNFGAKWVQPGQLLSTLETTFHHDCLTLGGNGGSPIVDVETGLVIGLHYAGRWLDYKRGEAVALWTVRDDEVLLPAHIRFVEGR